MLGTIVMIIIGLILLSLLAFWLVAERDKLLLPSTWQAMKENGLKRILNFKALHSYVYGRWTYAFWQKE